jgi:hypothetical protein
MFTGTLKLATAIHALTMVLHAGAAEKPQMVVQLATQVGVVVLNGLLLGLKNGMALTLAETFSAVAHSALVVNVLIQAQVVAAVCATAKSISAML